MKQMGAGHFAPEPKRPMQERLKFFLVRLNYVSQVPQVHLMRRGEFSKIRFSEWSNGKS